MQKQKSRSILATLSILSFAVACNSGGGGATSDRYAEGFAAGKAEGYSSGKTEGYASGKTDGYKEGYDKGYLDGDKDGYARAEVYFATADYKAGFADGQKVGLGIGYGQGYTKGKSDGFSLGYNDGHKDGKALGYDLGYDDGNSDGYDLGYKDGTNDGYDLGYDDGTKDGYEIGYDDGYDDGLEDGYAGLSVGQTPKLRGYADVLSAFHNDLIDYSKIKAPKATKRGLVANGQLLLSDISLTNKDTLKKQAVVEQYLVVEMSKQVQAKFGLSLDRSLQIAKAANHFRKATTARAFTAEDTNAYAKEIIGADFKAISKAYENSMKGDLSDLNSLLDVAAEKNGTSPEKMGEIVARMFL